MQNNKYLYTDALKLLNMLVFNGNIFLTITEIVAYRVETEQTACYNNQGRYKQ